MTEFSDFVTKNEKLFNKVNESIVSASFNTVKRVYIDLALLKDTRMGLMLSLSDKNDIQYLLSKIKQYNIRPNRKFTEVYPEFKIDEDTLNKHYHDPSYSETIFDYSPDTDFSVKLKSVILMYSSANNRAGYSDPIEITINAFPLSITENIKLFNAILNHLFIGLATFNLVSVDPKIIQTDHWATYSVLYIDDIEYDLTNGTLYKILFEQQKMTDKVIVAPYCCNEAVLDKWKQYRIDLTDINTTNDIFKLTEYVLSAFCYFSFIPFQIPISHQE